MKRKIVYIKRRKPAINLPDDLLKESTMKLGSVFTDTGDIAKGITFEEEKLYMPEIIGIPPTDNSFIRESKKYYSELEISIPFEGKAFDVTIDPDTNMPLNTFDFILYKFALANPTVAKDKKDAYSSNRYLYYIEDPDLEDTNKFEKLGVRKEAYKEYIKLAANKKREALVRQILGVSNKLTQEKADIETERKVMESPDEFLTIINDKSIETRVFIMDCVSNEVLKKVGNTYLDGEVNLGVGEQETILYIEDKRNSEHVLNMKARLEVFQKGR